MSCSNRKSFLAQRVLIVSLALPLDKSSSAASSQVSALVPSHSPSLQTSRVVHSSSSSHDRPSTGTASQRPVSLLHTPSVQGPSSSAQSTVTPTHFPSALHWSPLVQAFPSLQLVPADAGSASHAPVAGSHLPTLQSVLSAEQSCIAPEHTPCPSQTSFRVHRLPSSQAVFAASGRSTQAPASGSQVPRTHCVSNAEQLSSTPTHTPRSSQRSSWVHAFSSSQVVPGDGRSEHSPESASHVALMHGSSDWQ